MEIKNITAIDKFYAALEKVEKENKDIFYLSNTELTTIPEELWSLTHLKNLSITHNQVTEIPEDIARLKNLEVLSVSRNQLSTLPKAIAKLPLRVLSIGSNNFTEIPDWVYDCEKLEILNFGNLGMGMTANTGFNKITRISERIGALKHLKELNTSGNSLTQLPDALFELNNLEQLILAGISDMWWNKQVPRDLPREERSVKRREIMAQKRNAGLSELSPKIGQLKSLKKLAINYNRLHVLPKEIGKLTHLQFLDVQDNLLKSLPDSISRLLKLAELRIGSNQIELIPNWMGRMPRLKELRVFGNPVYDTGKKDRILKLKLRKIDYVDMYQSRR